MQTSPRNKKEPIIEPRDESDFGDSAVEILEEDYEEWLPGDDDLPFNFPVESDY